MDAETAIYWNASGFHAGLQTTGWPSLVNDNHKWIWRRRAPQAFEGPGGIAELQLTGSYDPAWMPRLGSVLEERRVIDSRGGCSIEIGTRTAVFSTSTLA